MNYELGMKEVLWAMLVVGCVCFILGFLAGCSSPERRPLWRDVAVADRCDPNGDCNTGKRAQ